MAVVSSPLVYQMRGCEKVPIRLGLVTIGALIMSMPPWVVRTVGPILGQVPADLPETTFAAAALTSTAGALVWVVKQVVSGKLVHRDPATATAKLADVLEESNRLQKEGLRREQVLTQILLQHGVIDERATRAD